MLLACWMTDAWKGLSQSAYEHLECPNRYIQNLNLGFAVSAEICRGLVVVWRFFSFLSSLSFSRKYLLSSYFQRFGVQELAGRYAVVAGYIWNRAAVG